MKTAGPGSNAGIEINMGGDSSALQAMLELNNSQKYSTLLERCHTEMESKPGWLTPYLFCGFAYLGSGNAENAAKMLSYFKKNEGPAYEVQPCQQMADFLRSKTTH